MVDKSTPAVASAGAENDGKKTYEQIDIKTGNVVATLTGRSPLLAAKKAATRGFTDIIIRQRKRGNNGVAAKLLRYSGYVTVIDRPMPYPKWLADKMKVPADQNKKGNEAKFPCKCKMSKAKRANAYKVMKVSGKDDVDVVSAFVKGLNK